MNNLVYLILRYLKEENVKYISEFDTFEGIETIQWSWTNSNGFCTSFRVIIYEDTIRASRHSGKAYTFSEEIHTFSDFKRIIY